MSKYLLIALGLCNATIQLSAQTERRSNFFGINPGITVEPFYEKGEMDINVFPLVYQRTLTKRADLRFTTICNLGLRNSGNKISHIGLESALPVFIRKKELVSELSKGFFIAPVLSLTRNRIAEHNNVGLWLEPGYHLLFDDNFVMSFGLQVGATFFAYDDGTTKLGNHFGAKIIFGKWM